MFKLLTLISKRNAIYNPRLIEMVVVIGLVYVMSQFFRTANGVIAKDLSADFDLTAAHLGVLTGSFFLSFAIVQIPVGMLFDRFGVRLITPIFLLAAVFGSAVYGFAENFYELLIGRLLIGIGVAPVLMGALFIFGRWANPSEYSTWMGRMIGIGGVGAMLSATPLALVTESFGWHYAFFGASAITALGAIMLYLVVRDSPSVTHEKNLDNIPSKPSTETFSESLSTMLSILSMRQLWPIIAMAFVSYPITITILGLWGAPWLIDVYGLNRVEAGNVMLWMAIALIIASILFGPLEKYLNSRKWIVIACSTLVGISLLIFAIWSKPPFILVVILLILIGLCSAYNIIIAGHGRSLFPDRLAGRGMSLIGIALMGGPFIMQGITGLIIGAFEERSLANVELSAEPYRAVFGFLALCIILANLLYFRLPDAKPSDGFAK